MTLEAPLRTPSPGSAADRHAPGLSTHPGPVEVDLGMLEQSLAFQVRKAQLALQRRGLRTQSALHVGAAEFGTLVLCQQNPGLAQFQIAAALDIDKASVVAVVDRLEELGWLLRRRSQQDRRRYGLFLTPEGQRQLQLLSAQSREAEAFARERLAPDEVRQLLGLLARLG